MSFQIKNVSVPMERVDAAGEKKTSWYNVGTAFVHDDGKISGEIVGYGKFYLFDRKKKGAQQPSGASTYNESSASGNTMPSPNQDPPMQDNCPWD